MTTTVPTILKFLNSSNNFNVIDQNIELPMRAKKRRLDHLSWEEKLQRKKLKNRVAAQTSRDRKKAKMEQMESALEEIYNKNTVLVQECDNLKAMNQRLLEENAELQKRLSQPCCQCHCVQNRSGVRESANGSTESLLPQRGAVTRSAAALDPQQRRRAALCRILLAACLLYQTCSTTSTSTSTWSRWSSSRKAYSRTSSKTLKEVLSKQKTRNNPQMEKIVLKKWWGRHQKGWNPVEVTV